MTALTAGSPGSGSTEHFDPGASKLGMWLFLFTEVMLFGALFLIYSVYRYNYLDDFKQAAAELSLPFGAFNTVVLLTSSLTMVLAIITVKKGEGYFSQMWILATVSLGFLFFCVKLVEWTAKFQHGIFPNSPELITLPRGEVIFFGLYFLMTGLHALHLAAGIVLLIYAGFLANEKNVLAGRAVLLENFGLYWHLVDVIWIFLFPLYYLIG